MGALNTGEALKIEQQARDQAAAAEREAVQNVDLAEMGDIAQQRQQFEDQQFAEKSALAARNFAGQEAAKGRAMDASQAQATRDLQVSMANAESALRYKLGRMSSKDQAKALKTASAQWAAQFQEDKASTEFNKRMAEKAANEKGPLGSIPIIGPILG